MPKSDVIHVNGGVNGCIQAMFYCPACECVHGMFIEDTNKPPGIVWGFNDDLIKPTFTPSICVTCEDKDGPTCCHSFVRDGQIEFLKDCTHTLAGKTVDLKPWPYGG